MFCPNCGTQLAENSKFCIKCGKALQNSKIPPLPSNQQTNLQPPSFYSLPKPSVNPLASAATTGGLTAMGGGGLVILGWAIGGGLAILKLIFLGGGFLGILTGMLADEAGGLIILLLSLALAAVVLIIPVLGFLCVRTGVNLIEKRSYTDNYCLVQVKEELHQIRSRVTTIFVQIVLIFVFTSFIPFIGNKVLGSGFYLMILGAVITFVGVLFARSQIGPDTLASTYKPTWHSQQLRSKQQFQLADQEKELLILLSQGMISQGIAKELGISSVEASSLTRNLEKKFGAANTTELVKLAQINGYLSNN